MKKIALAIGSILALGGPLSASEETLTFGRFGTVTVYRQSEHPSHVVLFVSGDGGWNLGVVDMARALVPLDALVLGIDITRYSKELEGGGEACSYPAADFEALSQFAQKKLGYPRYVSPLLVGYSSGATLVYAVLVQAPVGTFTGAMSLGFCPDLPLTKPFCRGSGLKWTAGPKGKGVSFEPAPSLSTPWVAFQGTVDRVCDPATTEAFAREVGNGRLVLLPKVGHGFSVQKNWMPQFKEAYGDLAGTAAPTPAPTELEDLPLVEVPSADSTRDRDLFAVLLSGDGGWAGLDREVASELGSNGVPVVGFDSLRYFWTRRTPEGAASDLARILRHYSATWHKSRVALVGYSLGADVLPFLVNRLPAELSSRLVLVALLGPSQDVDFEFHVTDWLRDVSRETSLPVLPEVQKLRGPLLLCAFGANEADSLCRNLDPEKVRLLPLGGAHHFGGDYKSIADGILRAIE